MGRFFKSAATLFSPAWRFSLGFVLGYYPLVVPLGLRVCLGLGSCLVSGYLAWRLRTRTGDGLSEECGELRHRRLRLVLIAVLCGGVSVGAFYSALGLGLEQRPWPAPSVAIPVAATSVATPAAPSVATPAAPSMAPPTSVAGKAVDAAPVAVGHRLARLKVVGVAAVLSADSRPARAGQRIMDLEVRKVAVEAPGIAGSYTIKADLRAIVRDGQPLASGASIEIRGRPAADGSALLFADRRDLIVRDEGGALSRLRNRLHEAFLAGLLAAVGRPANPGGRSSNMPPRPAIAGARPSRADARPADAGSDSRYDDAAGLLLALLAGWQDELSPEDAAAFKAAGCTHILALSGQHLALIATGLIFALRPLVGPLRALLPSFVIVWLYVIVVGPGPSLLRALLSFAIAAIASLSDRPQDGRTILGLCFATHALLFPGQLREAGFVLSYLAVGGLVVLAPRIDYLLSPFVPPPFAGALAASIAAQLATSPWIALFFGIVQPVGILATLATAALVEAVMIGGLLATLIVALVPMAALVTAPVELGLLRLLEEAMRFFAGLPSLRLDGSAPRWIAALAIVLLAAFLYAWPHVRFPCRALRAPDADGGPAPDADGGQARV